MTRSLKSSFLQSSSPSRREFLRITGRAAAASALAGVAVPACHAAENNTIKLALVGCGGRGTGAVADAFSTTGGPVKLYAMADLFDDRLQGSLKNLASRRSRTRSTCRPSAASSASTPTRRRSTASGPATWCS